MVTSYTTFRAKVKSFLDNVCHYNEPLYVTMYKGESVVIIPKSEYDGILETIHLLKSPKNAERLLEGIKQFEQGLAKEHQELT